MLEENIKFGVVIFAKNIDFVSEFYKSLFELSLVLKEVDMCVLESNFLTPNIRQKASR